jgi:hypothetical protein
MEKKIPISFMGYILEGHYSPYFQRFNISFFQGLALKVFLSNEFEFSFSTFGFKVKLECEC